MPAGPQRPHDEARGERGAVRLQARLSVAAEARLLPGAADPGDEQEQGEGLEDAGPGGQGGRTQACAAEGRDPATLWRSAAVLVEGAGAVPEGFPEGATGRGRPQSGAPAQLADLFRAYAAEGISHLQVWVNPTTVAGLEQLAPVLEALDRG